MPWPRVTVAGTAVVIRRRIVQGAMAECIAVALCAAGAAAAVGAAWTIEPTPTPAGVAQGVLTGVSCASQRACVAVGYTTNAAGAGRTLAERFNGTRWTVRPTPMPAGAKSGFLFGVSCATGRSCTAVGSVTSRTHTTVPLVEHYNGASWRIQHTAALRARRGSTSYLGGVSCASRRLCVAVGYTGNRAGTSGATLAQRWDGTHWSVQPTPDPAGARASFLSGVSCATATVCSAVGFSTGRAGRGAALAEQWSGSGWSIERSRTPAGATAAQFTGVSCESLADCAAVGYFTGFTGIEVMMAERRHATGWALQDTRYPAGARYVQLSGVSCASENTCTAVGLLNDTAGLDAPLAEHRSGRRWVVQPTPDPPGATDSSLDAVSCPSVRVCVAVGTSTRLAGHGATLAERYSASPAVGRG